jgi:hypothetical protein
MYVRRLLIASAVLTLLCAQASAQFDDKFPKSPTKKPPPKWEVRTATISLLDGCGSAMTAHNKNPALATDEEHLPPILAALRRELHGMNADIGSHLNCLERKYR